MAHLHYLSAEERAEFALKVQQRLLEDAQVFECLEGQLVTQRQGATPAASVETLERLRFHAHRLCGLAAVFAIGSVDRAARALEQTIRGALGQHPSGCDIDTIRVDHIEVALTALRQALAAAIGG